jgi:hypothetical protein
MQKVLPGTSREALGMVFSQWRSLLQISAIPLVFYGLMTFWQIRTMGNMYRSMGTMIVGDKINPAFMGEYFRSMGLTMIGSLLGGVFMMLMFVQIIRFHSTGEVRWLITDKVGLKATLFTLLYGIGIMMLTMLAYMGALIVLFMVSIIPAILLGSSPSGGIAVGVMMGAGVLGVLAFLYWFMFRFMVGLPGVALGSTPDFFKDMWPLSKGETWGLPLRAIGSMLIAYIPMLIIMGLFMWPTLKDIINNPAFAAGNDNPELVFPLIADIMDNMSWALLVSMVIMVPFMWYMTLMLAIAFQRFRDRQSSQKNQAFAK